MHEADARGFRPVDLVAGEQHALGLLGAQPIDPHGRRRAAPDARGHVADLRLVLHHDDVAAQRNVGTAGDRIAVHLAHDRPVAAPQAHEELGVAHHEGVVLHWVPHGDVVGGMTFLRLRVIGEIVARAEAGAVACEHDDMHAAICIGALDAFGELARNVVIDGVHHLRTIERDAADTAVFFVENFRHGSSRCGRIARCATARKPLRPPRPRSPACPPRNARTRARRCRPPA